MNLKEQANKWVKSVVSNHIGGNVRSLKWTTYTGEIAHNQLGGISYLQPTEGKVVDENDDFTLVKTGPGTFCVVLKEKLSEKVAVGDKVSIKFYTLRRFDGTAADGTEDPSLDGSRVIALTGAKTRFPVKWDGRYLGVDERFGVISVFWESSTKL